MSTSSPESFTLLSLPPEILQSILRYVTTPSFLQLCRACTTLRNIARTSRKVLLYHLLQIPGVKLGLEDRSTSELFLLLHERAAQNLFGINFRADHLFFPVTAAPIDPNASEICPGVDPNLAIVCRNRAVVHLSHATQNGIQPRVTLILHPPYNLFRSECHVEIIKVRISDPRIDFPYPELSTFSTPLSSVVSILFKVVPCFPCDQPALNHLESKSWPAVRRGLFGVAQLAVTEDKVQQMRLGMLPHEPYCDAFTLAIDNSEMGTLAVGWRHWRSIGNDYEDSTYCSADVTIGLYHYENGDFVSAMHSIALGETTGGLPLPQQLEGLAISDISIARNRFGCSQRILIHPPGSLTYDLLVEPVRAHGFFFSELDHSPHRGIMHGEAKCLDNGLPVQTFKETFLFKIGLPFFAIHEGPHEAHGPPQADDAAVCSTTLLKLGFHVKDYDPDDGYQGSRIAVIFRQVVSRDHSRCHVLNDLQSIQPVDQSHHVVARLWGFRVPQTNRPGVIATSRGSTRIAIGNWNRIMIWALNPWKLAENTDNASRYYEREVNEMVDDSDRDTIALLRPVVLNLDDGAVVRQMKFAHPNEYQSQNHIVRLSESDDILFVMTDRGMVVFDLGPSTKGVREVKDWQKPKETMDIDLPQMDLF